MIEDYAFGKIKIEGKIYTNDLIIFPDKIIDNWWRKQGHLLQVEDLKDVFEYKPDLLIIGKGYNSQMKVNPDVQKKAKELDIGLKTLNSKEAAKFYNKNKEKAILAIHLTC